LKNKIRKNKYGDQSKNVVTSLLDVRIRKLKEHATKHRKLKPKSVDTGRDTAVHPGLYDLP
jgi:hypothetical protein